MYSQLERLMGPLGLYQHARYAAPRLEEGYCTDDNARCVQVLLEKQAYPTTTKQFNENHQLSRCWRFITAAQMPVGRFRNFRNSDGQWLDSGESEDTQARVARAIITYINYSHHGSPHQAQAMLHRLTPTLTGLNHPRALAEAAIALSEYTNDRVSLKTLAVVWEKLWRRWQEHSRPDWPWPDSQLTYGSALMTHGLLAGAATLGRLSDPAVKQAILDSTAFLIDTTCQPKYFQPLGNEKWVHPGSQPAPYDQQPIEAHTMLDLLLAYDRIMDQKLPPQIIAAPYRWFLGRNSQHTSLVGTNHRACYDGLTPQGVNRNQGAESLLAYLRSELLMQQANARINPRAIQNRTGP